jgi:hypothetical protein
MSLLVPHLWREIVGNPYQLGLKHTDAVRRGEYEACWEHKHAQVSANWVSNDLLMEFAQKKSSSILPSPVPNLSFKSALVRSWTKGT